ncbi:MAG: type II toxin-antitoxin system RelE/ParE family toxin [Planctomycetes bacterium]|nr:type II toxin-antitoxin system RelE/ParE family toxin [Planctomycetota bacterium]
MPAKDFYDRLSKGDQAKLNNLFLRMADHGRIANRQKFKQVEGDLFAFKSFRIRVSCYQNGRCWYLLHGFEKKGDDWPRGEVIRGLNLLAEHRGQ